MSDDSDQMERLAVGLLSFKHLRPDAKARFRSDLRNLSGSSDARNAAPTNGSDCRLLDGLCFVALLVRLGLN